MTQEKAALANSTEFSIKTSSRLMGWGVKMDRDYIDLLFWHTFFSKVVGYAVRDVTRLQETADTHSCGGHPFVYIHSGSNSWGTTNTFLCIINTIYQVHQPISALYKATITRLESLLLFTICQPHSSVKICMRWSKRSDGWTKHSLKLCSH